jgi:hypothetical protein
VPWSATVSVPPAHTSALVPMPVTSVSAAGADTGAPSGAPSAARATARRRPGQDDGALDPAQRRPGGRVPAPQRRAVVAVEQPHAHRVRAALQQGDARAADAGVLDGATLVRVGPPADAAPGRVEGEHTGGAGRQHDALGAG